MEARRTAAGGWRHKSRLFSQGLAARLITLQRQAGLDYSKLKGLLADGEFQAADDETRDLLIRLAGPEAVKRKWVYFTEVCSHWLPRLFSFAMCSRAGSWPSSDFRASKKVLRLLACVQMCLSRRHVAAKFMHASMLLP